MRVVRSVVKEQMVSLSRRGVFGTVRHTLLLVDGDLDVEVDGGDNQVASKVKSAGAVEHIGIIERNALRNLHHSKNDDQVGAIVNNVSILIRESRMIAPWRGFAPLQFGIDSLTSEERWPF